MALSFDINIYNILIYMPISMACPYLFGLFDYSFNQLFYLLFEAV